MTEERGDYVVTEEVREINNVEKLGVLAGRAIEALEAYFADTDPDKNDRERARVAASVLSTWARNEATQSAREALAGSLAVRLAGSKEELRDYIRMTMPGSPLNRMIGSGSK